MEIVIDHPDLWDLSELLRIAPQINTSLLALVPIKSKPFNSVITLIPPTNLLLSKILTRVILLHLIPAARSECFSLHGEWWTTIAFPFTHHNFLAAVGAVWGKQFHLVSQNAVENFISANFFKRWKFLPLNGIWLGTRGVWMRDSPAAFSLDLHTAVVLC